jgi:hypothetical protein
MNTRNSKHSYNGPELDFARSLKAGIACALAAGILLVAACGDGAPQIVQQAVAAPADESTLYIPAQFPPIEGEPEAHIEAF